MHKQQPSIGTRTKWSSFQGINQNANAGMWLKRLGYTKNYPIAIKPGRTCTNNNFQSASRTNLSSFQGIEQNANGGLWWRTLGYPVAIRTVRTCTNNNFNLAFQGIEQNAKGAMWSSKLGYTKWQTSGSSVVHGIPWAICMRFFSSSTSISCTFWINCCSFALPLCCYETIHATFSIAIE
jgi:hypothetical protein